MGGFSSISGDETIMFADNSSFDGTQRGGKMTTDGQLWIGSTASRHVKLGSLSSPDGSVTIGYSSPNITLVAGSTTPTTFTTNSGNATPAGNILNILGLSGSKTSGAGNTVTIKSPPFSQVGASATSSLNTGEFVTA